MENMKQEVSDQEITQTVEINAATDAAPSLLNAQAEAFQDAESVDDVEATPNEAAAHPDSPAGQSTEGPDSAASAHEPDTTSPSIADDDFVDFEEVDAPRKPGRALIAVPAAKAPARRGKSSAKSLDPDAVGPVELVGSYQLPPEVLELLKSTKAEVLVLMKLDIRGHFRRASLMHSMASVFEVRAEGLNCLVTEFGFSREHCVNCVNLHEHFAGDADRFVAFLIPPTVGYELAHADRAFQEEILNEFEEGKPSTVTEIQTRRKAHPATASTANKAKALTFGKGLKAATAIATATTMEDIHSNLARAAAAIDKALIKKASGGYKLGPAKDLQGELGGRCLWLFEQLSNLTRPIVAHEKATVYNTVTSQGASDRGVVALLAVTKKLSKVQQMKIRAETSWIINVAAPVLRWGAGRKVDGIDDAIAAAVTGMSYSDREDLWKEPPKQAA